MASPAAKSRGFCASGDRDCVKKIPGLFSTLLADSTHLAPRRLELKVKKSPAGRTTDESRSSGLSRGASGPALARTLYVHMNSGQVIESFPSTSVRMTDNSLVVLNGDETVATFARAVVYFATYRLEQPFPL